MKNNLPKILVAGNCVVDLIFRGEIFAKRTQKGRLSLAFGGKYVPEEFFQFYGGGGANAAISLAAQGLDVMLWSHIGNDLFARQVLQNLKQAKVKANLVKSKAERTPISSILLTPQGERTIINYRSDADHLTLTNQVLREMGKRDWLVIFSLAHCPKKEKLRFLKEAKKRGLKIFLSLHGTEYMKGYDYLRPYFSLADMVQINAHELADIFGGNAPDFNFRKTNFSQKIKVPLLVVSYDVKGSFAYTPEKIYHQPKVLAPKVVDTTGAGDAFGSGFLGEYLKTDDISKALLFGARNACSVIQQMGAQNGFLAQ